MTVTDSKDPPSTSHYSWEIRPHFDDDDEPRPNVKLQEEPLDKDREINRLHRELNRANATIARQDDLIKTLRKALDNVGSYLHRSYHHDEWGTKGSLRRLISRTFGARDYKGSDG